MTAAGRFSEWFNLVTRLILSLHRRSSFGSRCRQTDQTSTENSTVAMCVTATSQNAGFVKEQRRFDQESSRRYRSGLICTTVHPYKDEELPWSLKDDTDLRSTGQTARW